MNSHNQHYTINDLSNLSNLSNNTYGSITNEEIKKEIISHKQSIEAQKRLINNFKTDLQNNSNFNSYDLLKTDSNEKDLIIKLKEELKNITKENKSLKNIIKEKDKLISEFEEVVLKSKQKLTKLQKLNDAFKEEIIILKSNGKINSEISNKYNKNDLNLKKENINNKFNNIQIQVNNSINKNINNNNEIEVDINENEKDKLIEKLNNQLIYIYNEYINLSNIIDEMNAYLSNNNFNPNYNELKLKYDDLMKENKILKQKNTNNNSNKIEELKKIINDKDKEIQNIKKNYEELFKNYQNTMFELKEKEKIYKSFQNKILEKNKYNKRNNNKEHNISNGININENN